MQDNKTEQVLKDMELRRVSLHTNYEVVMANDLVKGTSNLSLYELKLLRLLIMQIKPQDNILHPYKIKVSELKELVGLDNKKIYSYAQKMCLHLLKEVILIGDTKKPHKKWVAFQWVSHCEYDNGEFIIKLNDSLKPYLVGLTELFTHFKLEEIVRLNTSYSIRLLELLHMAFRTEFYGQKNEEVYIDLETLRRAFNLENKYKGIGKFKERVLDSAIKELNDKTGYHISYREYKAGRKVEGFYFLVQQQWEYEFEQRQRQDQQLTVEDALIETVNFTKKESQ